MAKIRTSFEREMEVRVPLRLEVTTRSGDFSVHGGENGKLTVTSEFGVRAGSQEEAEELARTIRENPPIEVEGELVRVGDLSRYNLGKLALAHTFYLLSKHPEAERTLHAELERVLGGPLPSADDVRALPYTERVIKESMRLFPPAWTTGREAAEEVEVGGYVLPKGSQILTSQWVVHRDPRWFPNPEGFDPDRWEPERAAGIPRYAYFPFGGGPRVCIGSHFATMEAILLLATILRRHRMEIVPGQRLELQPTVTLRQRGPRRSADCGRAGRPRRAAALNGICQKKTLGSVGARSDSMSTTQSVIGWRAFLRICTTS